MSGTPMKLILTQEVTGLGAPGDVVDVAGGYGRNYLVPRGLAMRWTRGAEKQIDLIKRGRAVREIRGLDDARDAASRLGSLTVRLKTKAGGGGRLFGSISPADIAAAVLAAIVAALCLIRRCSPVSAIRPPIVVGSAGPTA